MKQLFILFLMVSINLYPQGRNGFELPNDKVTCLTSLHGSLYSGIDNYIMIDTSLTQACDTFFLTITNGTVYSDTLNSFLILPSRPGNARVVLKCIQDLDTVILGYRNFSVFNLPEPQIVLNGKPLRSNASLSKSEFYSCDSVNVYFSDDLPGSGEWLKIKSFTIGYTYGGFHVSHTNESNIISEKTRQLISTLRPDYAISVKFIVESEGKVKKQLPIYRINIY